MFNTLVVPIDGSDFAAKVIPTASMISKMAGARLHLVGIARDDTELVWTYDHVHDWAHKMPAACVSKVDVIVDPDPAGILLGMAGTSDNVLCFASHDRMPLSAKLLHSVGSELIARAQHPFLVVGAVAASGLDETDIVVAVDGVHDPQPILDVAVRWARQLEASLRIVTVYEPVLPDLRRPAHFTRGHGPPGDPDEYLAEMARDVAPHDVAVSTAAIADPVSAAAGLDQHLASNPACLLVVGGPRAGLHLGAGTVRELLRSTPVPLLVARGASEDDAS